jgi:hypothetical protein
LPPDPPLRAKAKGRPASDDQQTSGVKVILLVAMLPVLSASIVGNNQIFNAYLVWAEKSADLRLFGIPYPHHLDGVSGFHRLGRLPARHGDVLASIGHATPGAR